MATAIILLQLAIVLALIFIGARVGGNRKNTLSTRYRTRYCTAVARCDVPCRKRMLLNHSVPISPNVICGNGLYRTFSSTIEVPMLNL